MRKLSNAFTFSNMKRTIAMALVSCMTLESVQAVPAAPMAGGPVFSIALPPALGYVTDSYSAGRQQAGHPDVILIQNLHVNRSVQFAISGILKHLKAQNLLPERIAVEGATGTMDIASMQAYPDASIRKAAADYLVQQGEMPGAMHFAVTEGVDGRTDGRTELYGVETAELYQANLEVYQRSYEQRRRLSDELNKYKAAIPRLERDPALREKAVLLSSDIDAALDLLNNRTTPDELAGALHKMLGSIDRLKAILPDDLSSNLIETLSSGAHFYSFALMRNDDLFNNTVALRDRDHQQTTVLITGGFHTNALAERCKAKGLSYVVIAPNVRVHDAVDERLYTERLLGHHLTPDQVAQGLDWAEMDQLEPEFHPEPLFQEAYQAEAKPFSAKARAPIFAVITALLAMIGCSTSPTANIEDLDKTTAKHLVVNGLNGTQEDGSLPSGVAETSLSIPSDQISDLSDMSALPGPVTMVLTITGDQGAWLRPELGNWSNSGTLYTPLSSIQLDNKAGDNSTVVLIKLNPAQLTGLHEIRLRRGPEKSSDGKPLGNHGAAANARIVSVSFYAGQTKAAPAAAVRPSTKSAPQPAEMRTLTGTRSTWPLSEHGNPLADILNTGNPFTFQAGEQLWIHFPQEYHDQEVDVRLLPPDPGDHSQPGNVQRQKIGSDGILRIDQNQYGEGPWQTIEVHSGITWLGDTGNREVRFTSIEIGRPGHASLPAGSTYDQAQLFVADQNLSGWRGFVAFVFLFAAGLYSKGIRRFNRRGQVVNLGVISMAIIAGLLLPVRMVSQTQTPSAPIIIPFDPASSAQGIETASAWFDRSGTDLTGYRVQAAIRGPRDRMVRWEFVAQNGDVTLLPPARNVRLNGNPQIITVNLADFNVDLTQGGRIRLSYGQLTDDGDTLNQTNAQPGEVVIRQFVLSRSAGPVAAAPVEPPVATPAPVVAPTEPAPQPQTPAPAAEAAVEVLAQGTSGSYKGTIGDQSFWADGQFDLPAGTVLRITFPQDQAGTKFRLRLLPDRSRADQPFGLDRTIHTIPANGIFEITIRASTFGLSEARLHHIEQISVHSGADGFGSLRQGADKLAIFEKIEKVASSGRAQQQLPAPAPAQRPQAPAPAPAPEAAVEVLAQRTSGSYNGTIGDHSVWADGEFDLPAGTVLRITFPKDQAGTKFRLRLLPDRSRADQPFGLNRAIQTIPASGVFEITIRGSAFGLSDAQLRHIEQISIHSGADGFGALGQDADKLAIFEKIEKVASSGRAQLPPAPEPAARPTAAVPPPPQRAAVNRQGFSMEFDGPANSKPDPTQWTYDLGAGGWGNNELETYTNSAENAHLDGQGHLVIHVVANNGRYTSARLKTQGLISAQYGHLEARIKPPSGQGIWPAWWMLGSNFDSQGWPNAGEIDILEMRGREPNINLGTAHGPGYSGGNGISESTPRLPDGQKFSDGFHTYAIDWSPQSITWYVDGNAYHTVTRDSLPSGATWVFDQPFFMLLNVAVGGNFGGNPDSTTRFPVDMVVDYIRYTPLAGGNPAAAPAPQRAGVPTRQPATPAASGNERAELIASHTGGHYSGTIGDYSVWADGEFDLPTGTVLRITFPKSQAGTKFRLRLLPDRRQADQPIGLDRAIHTVPANGIFEITINPATFGLSESRLHHIEQISVHSGADGFGALGQDADKQAIFEKIEKVTHRAAVIDLSHPVRSAVLAALDTPLLLLLGQNSADVVDAVSAEAPIRTFPHPGPGFHIRSTYRAQLGQAAGYAVGGEKQISAAQRRQARARIQRDLGHVLDVFGTPEHDPNAPEYKGETIADAVQRDYSKTPLVERAQKTVRVVTQSAAWRLGQKVAMVAGLFIGGNRVVEMANQLHGASLSASAGQAAHAAAMFIPSDISALIVFAASALLLVGTVLGVAGFWRERHIMGPSSRMTPIGLALIVLGSATIGVFQYLDRQRPTPVETKLYDENATQFDITGYVRDQKPLDLRNVENLRLVFSPTEEDTMWTLVLHSDKLGGPITLKGGNVTFRLVEIVNLSSWGLSPEVLKSVQVEVIVNGGKPSTLDTFQTMGHSLTPPYIEGTSSGDVGPAPTTKKESSSKGPAEVKTDHIGNGPKPDAAVNILSDTVRKDFDTLKSANINDPAFLDALKSMVMFMHPERDREDRTIFESFKNPALTLKLWKAMNSKNVEVSMAAADFVSRMPFDQKSAIEVKADSILYSTARVKDKLISLTHGYQYYQAPLSQSDTPGDVMFRDNGMSQAASDIRVLLARPNGRVAYRQVMDDPSVDNRVKDSLRQIAGPEFEGKKGAVLLLLFQNGKAIITAVSSALVGVFGLSTLMQRMAAQAQSTQVLSAGISVTSPHQAIFLVAFLVAVIFIEGSIGQLRDRETTEMLRQKLPRMPIADAVAGYVRPVLEYAPDWLRAMLMRNPALAARYGAQINQMGIVAIAAAA